MKRLPLVLALLLALMVSLVPASTYAASGVNPNTTIIPTDTQGFGLYFRPSYTSISATLSVTTDVTIPNLNNDACDNPNTCSLEYTKLAETLHVKNFCPVLQVVWEKIENDAQVQQLQVANLCATNSANFVTYSQDISNSTWRTAHVFTGTNNPFHAGWTGQSTFAYNIIYARLNKNGATCMDAQVWNGSTAVWETLSQICGSYFPTGGDHTYWWYSIYGSGSHDFGAAGDLGSVGVLEISQMQYFDGSNWNNLVSKDADLTMHQFIFEGTPRGQAIQPLLSENWLAEWSAGTGFSPDATAMYLCDKRNGSTICDYTQNHYDYESYHGYSGSGGWTSINPPTNLSIQRASPDNSILRGYNPKLKADRSYYIFSDNWGTATSPYVDVGGLGSGNYTITTQGYVLRGGGSGNAPTCSYTGTKYTCVAGTNSPIQQVWVKIKTAAGINVNGLSVGAGNSVDNFTRTVFIEV